MVNEDFEDHDDHGQDVNIDNATQEQGDEIKFYYDEFIRATFKVNVHV